MPALFSIGQHAALAAVQAQLLPGEALHAYLDDVYAVVQPNRVRPVYELLARHLHTHAHIQLNSGKTRLWNQAGQQPPNTEDLGSSTWVGNPDLPREQQGLTILGVPVGSPEFVQAQLQHIQENHATLLQQLPHLNDLQVSWLLLLYTASPRSNFLLRLLPPNITATFAQTHDAAITACLAQLLEQQDMPAPALARAHLPLAAGGLGLAPATFLAAAAHWASWADALPVLQRQAPHIATEALRHFSHPTTAPPALQAAAEARQTLAGEDWEPPTWAQLVAEPAPPAERNFLNNTQQGQCWPELGQSCTKLWTHQGQPCWTPNPALTQGGPSPPFRTPRMPSTRRTSFGCSYSGASASHSL